MSEFLKASKDLINVAPFRLDREDCCGLCKDILYAFSKIKMGKEMDDRLNRLKQCVELKSKQNTYNSLHSAFWYLKRRNINISDMDDFAKIIYEKNEELYMLKENLKKGKEQ